MTKMEIEEKVSVFYKGNIEAIYFSLQKAKADCFDLCRVYKRNVHDYDFDVEHRWVKI